MKIEHIDREDLKRAEADAPKPSKVDLLTQVEADWLNAKAAGEKDAMKALEERKKVVNAAKDDEAARVAYADATSTITPDEEAA